MNKDTELNSKEGKHNEEVKTAYTSKKRKKKAHPMAEQVKAFYIKYGDVNRVSAQLMLSRVVVEQILEDENI